MQWFPVKWFSRIFGYALTFAALGAVIAIAPFSSPTSAQAIAVQQGSGNPSVQEWYAMTGARRAGKTTEVCVTNAAGGSFVPGGATHGPLTARKAIEIQNNGANSIFCTVDGQAPLATGALGREITSGNVWSMDIGPGVAVRCIAETAAQVTPACSMITELR